MRWAFHCAALAILATACGASPEHEVPPCGSHAYHGHYLVPGPGEPAFDAALERAAFRYDRAFSALHSFATGLNADLEVPLDDAAARADLQAFFSSDGDAAAFEAAHGHPITQAIAGWEKSAGLYSGAGIAADAYRYGALRDQGYDCAEIESARAQLARSITALHIASTIGGVPGVMARSLARTDLPGDGPRQMVVPLFDASGSPLPAEKNNGTWRADNSGMYPNYIWEDSMSRDMFVGWAMAFGAIWEVVRDDGGFSGEVKAALKADAAAILRSFFTVREAGYDLEIHDADGRTTFHGFLNENAFEHAYIPGVGNGFYAGMAVGIAAALASVAEDAELDRYLQEQLIDARDLPAITGHDMLEVNLGVASNFSNYNMAFTGLWLGTRYLKSDIGRGKLRVALDRGLYAVRDSPLQPNEMKQSFFDFIFAAGMAESRPGMPARTAFDAGAVARGLETLGEFPPAPYWDVSVMNCDDAEVMAGSCTLTDGTVVKLSSMLGRGDKLVAEVPIPMRVRPPSNYHWRSNPYEPNGGGDGSRLLPAVDFRTAYWLGRFARGAD